MAAAARNEYIAKIKLAKAVKGGILHKVEDFKKEMNRSLRQSHEFVHEICKNVIQFLHNSEVYLRNGDSSQLSFTFPFVIALNDVEQFLQPSVMDRLRNLVTREDELLINLWVNGCIGIKEKIISVVTSDKWELFQKWENDEEILNVFRTHETCSESDSRVLLGTSIKRRIRDYFSASNVFRTTNTALTEFLQTTRQPPLVVSTESSKKRKASPYENLRTEDPVSKPKKSHDINPPLKSRIQKSSPFILGEDEIINIDFVGNDDGYASVDDSMCASVVHSQCASSVVHSQCASVVHSQCASVDDYASVTDKDDSGFLSMVTKPVDLIGQLADCWADMKKQAVDITSTRVTEVESAFKVLKSLFLSSTTSSTLPKKRMSTSEEVFSNQSNRQTIELDGTFCLKMRRFFDNQYDHNGLIAPQSFCALENPTSRDRFLSSMHSCSMLVYSRVLSTLFLNAKKVVHGGSEYYHYKNLELLIETFDTAIRNMQPVYLLSNEKGKKLFSDECCSNTSDAFLQSISWINVFIDSKMFIQLGINALANKTCFEEEVREKWCERRRSGQKLDLSILYVAFVGSIDEEDNVLGSGAHVPFHLDIEPQKFSKKVDLSIPTVRSNFMFRICAVMYRNKADSQDIVFSVVDAMRDINMFQHSVYQVQVQAVHNLSPTLFGSTFTLPGQKSLLSEIHHHHAFPATYEKDGETFVAIGSFWARTDEKALYNLKTPIIECLPSTCFGDDSEFPAISTDDLVNGLAYNGGWLVTSQIHLFMEKASSYFVDSRNILCLDLFEFIKANEPDRWGRLFKDLYKEGRTLFDNGNVLHIPINWPIGSHWVYCYVVISTKSVILVDSMNMFSSGTYLTSTILDFLETFYNQKQQTSPPFNRQQWTCIYNQHTPDQMDYCSCGIFLILNAMRMIQRVKNNEDVMQASWKRVFSQEDKAQLRHLMCNIVMKNLDISTLLSYVVTTEDTLVTEDTVVEEAFAQDVSVPAEVAAKAAVVEEVVSASSSEVVVQTRRKSQRNAGK